MEQARPFGQMRKQAAQVASGPAVEGAAANDLKGEQQAQRHEFAGEQPRLRMFLLVGHDIIHPNQ